MKGYFIMLKIVIVGTGIILKAHLSGLEQLDDCKPVAVCDINEEKAKASSEATGVPYFLNYKDLPANVDFDAAILNLPHGLHCEATEFFLNAGKHVLVEKPMANTVEECERMIAAAKKNNKKLAIAHVQRFTPAIQMVKKIYDSGELGKLCMYTETRTCNYFEDKRPRWFLDKKMAGGGIVMNFGAHALDKLFYVMEDANITSIDAQCGNYNNDYTIEGHAQIFAKFDNGVTASVTFSGYTNSGYEACFYFTNGALKVNGHTLQINRDGAKGFEPVELYGYNAFTAEIDAFHKYIKEEPNNIPDGEYGKKVIETIEKIYENIV